MLSRRIVFLGDCQAIALMKAYRDFVAPFTGELITWVDAGRANEAEVRSIAEADVVVSQVFNIETPVSAAGMRADALKVEFPAVFIGFLWPYSGQAAHVRNTPVPLMGHGPYDGQVGDIFLNRLIQQGIAADEALKRYLDLDIVRAAHLDRLLELHLGAQASRDERTGFGFSRIIEARFRDTQLFLTSSHPTLALVVPLIQEVFERLGVPAATTEAAIQAQRVAPFPQTALPIHPGIIRHFGLQVGE